MVEQEKLLVKYQKIEGLKDWPLHLDVRENQRIIKDYIARCTEELAEAAEYLNRKDQGETIDMELYHEEVIDALHFYLNVLLLTGKDNTAFDLDVSNLSMESPMLMPIYTDQLFWEITYHLFLARNELKSKPWKQTELPTDKTKFHQLLHKAGVMFNVLLFTNLKWDREEIYQQYMKKNKINQFRQKSNY